MKRPVELLVLAAVAAALAAPPSDAAPPSSASARKGMTLRLSRKTASRPAQGQPVGPLKTAPATAARRQNENGYPIPLPTTPPVAGLPDLVIAHVEYMPSSRTPRFITIANRGGSPVSGCQLYVAYLKSEFPNRYHRLGEYTIDVPQTLRPGGHVRIRPPRNHTADAFRAVVDPNRRVRESNERNNGFTNTL